jgi:hypothetical protein
MGGGRLGGVGRFDGWRECIAPVNSCLQLTETCHHTTHQIFTCVPDRSKRRWRTTCRGSGWPSGRWSSGRRRGRATSGLQLWPRLGSCCFGEETARLVGGQVGFRDGGRQQGKAPLPRFPPFLCAFVCLHLSASSPLSLPSLSPSLPFKEPSRAGVRLKDSAPPPRRAAVPILLMYF